MLFQDSPDNPVALPTQTAFKAITDGNITSDDLMLLWANIGWPVTKALILLIGIWLAAGWVRRISIKVLRKAQIDETIARFLSSILRWVVLLAGGIAILGIFGIETTSFAAVLASLGFAVGMALSGSLGNVASGVMILIFRPYKVADVINVSGVTGKVNEVGLFATTLDTFDNRRIIIPNNSIFTSTIENITFHDKRRIDVAVGTDYAADIDKTREILMAVAQSVPGRLTDENPAVILSELAGSSIDWSVRVWAPTSEFGTVKQQLTRDIKVALDNASIGIPYPQMDVHINGGIS